MNTLLLMLLGFSIGVNKPDSCAERVLFKGKRVAKLVAGGLLIPAGAYSVFEVSTTDSVHHSYACADCEPQTQPLSIALLGDSMSTDFFFSSDLPTLYRLRTTRSGGWFTDRSPGAPECFAETCATSQPVCADCYAQPGASILGSPDASIGKRLGHISHLEQQVDELLSAPHLPDHIYVWIGHNDADFAYTCERNPKLDERQVCERLPQQLTEGLTKQLTRVADAARSADKQVTITVFGLLDMKRMIAIREQILQRKAAHPELYPYLAQGIDGFPTLQSKHTEMASALSAEINTGWKEMIAQLNRRYPEGVRFKYSDAFNALELSVKDISHQDGLHFSPHGSARLAKAAREVAP